MMGGRHDGGRDGVLATYALSMFQLALTRPSSSAVTENSREALEEMPTRIVLCRVSLCGLSLCGLSPWQGSLAPRVGLQQTGPL